MDIILQENHLYKFQQDQNEDRIPIMILPNDCKSDHDGNTTNGESSIGLKQDVGWHVENGKALRRVELGKTWQVKEMIKWLFYLAFENLYRAKNRSHKHCCSTWEWLKNKVPGRSLRHFFHGREQTNSNNPTPQYFE